MSFDYRILAKPHPRVRIKASKNPLLRKAWLSVYENILEKSERYPTEELQKLQEKRLMTLIDRIRKTVPFYSEHLKEVRTLEEFQKLAPLTKHDLRKALESGSICNPKLEAFKVHRSTSGSSGVPFIFFHDSNMYTRRIAFYRRLLRWIGFKEGDVAVWIMREMHPEFGAIPFVCFGPEDIERRKQELYDLFEAKPVILHAMTSHLVFLADLFTKDGKSFNFKGIISYAEPLYFEVRQYLEEKFRAPIFDNYGSQEILNPANECEQHNGFHVNSEWTYLEVVDKDNQPLPPGRLGTILMTSFDNEVMPFVRYKIGDLGYWMEGTCPCGRTLPRLKVAGREMHYFIHPSGKVGDFISLVLPILRMTPKVLEFQIERFSRTRYTTRLVPTAQYDKECGDTILAEMRKYLGDDTEIDLHVIEAIPLGPGGKPRVFINHENDLPIYTGESI